MKKIFSLFLLAFFFSIDSYSQYIHKIKADSVLITNDSCNAELNLENSTKDTIGFLYNKGKGRTEFRRGLIRINDSLYIIGNDTLNIAKGASGNYIQNQTAALQASGAGFFIEKGIFGQSAANGTTKSKLTIDPNGTYLFNITGGNSTNPIKLSHGIMTMDLTSVNTVGMKLFNIAGTPNTGIIPFYVNLTDNHMTSSATGFDLSYLRTAAGVNYPTYGLKSTVDSYAGTGYAYYANATATGGGTAYAFYAPAGRNYFADNVLIGTTTNISSSKLTVASATQGFLKPRMTTTQRDAIVSPVAGLEIYNTTTKTTDHYDGTAWVSGSYIYNQVAAAQPASAWVSGQLIAGSTGSPQGSGYPLQVFGNMFIGGSLPKIQWSNQTLLLNGVSSNGRLELTTAGTDYAFQITSARIDIPLLSVGTTVNTETAKYNIGYKSTVDLPSSNVLDGFEGFYLGANVRTTGSGWQSLNTNKGNFITFYPLTTSVNAATEPVKIELQNLIEVSRTYSNRHELYQRLTIGEVENQASAQLTISSTTSGFLPPRMTTTQRNAIASPVAGLSLYNTTLNTNDTYNGSEYFSFGNQIILPATNTAAGTTGNQTINKASGTVNIAAGGTTVTVTNSLVSANSIVIATLRTNDATAYVKNVVPAAGSFTINLGAAATGEVNIGFVVFN